jgi:hypothetical protein
MSRILAGLSGVGFVLVLAVPTFAKAETVKGQLIDQACYKMDKANTGMKHNMPNGPKEDCATACAKMGRPVALLTSDGKVYQITGDLSANKNEKLVAHMSHTVEVTGDVTTEADGSMKIAGTSLKMISR